MKIKEVLERSMGGALRAVESADVALVRAFERRGRADKRLEQATTRAREVVTKAREAKERAAALGGLVS